MLCRFTLLPVAFPPAPPSFDMDALSRLLTMDKNALHNLEHPCEPLRASFPQAVTAFECLMVALLVSLVQHRSKQLSAALY